MNAGRPVGRPTHAFLSPADIAHTVTNTQAPKMTRVTTATGIPKQLHPERNTVLPDIQANQDGLQHSDTEDKITKMGQHRYITGKQKAHLSE